MDRGVSSDLHWEPARRAKELHMPGITATAEVWIAASPDTVWRTLTDPAAIRQFMFGTTVVTDWQPGGAILWKGEYQGRSYEDKGELLVVEPERRLTHTHFSPLAGREDVPENYHTLTYTLDAQDGGTMLTFTQDNNPTQDAADHSQANWQQMLERVKTIAENGRSEH
jgi:uncharacterized protein YndB with AHSA1/START domain